MEVCTLTKRLAIIGAGVEQVYAYKLAAQLGVETVGTDINPEAPAFKYADHRLIASTRDAQATFDALNNFHQKKPIHGVMTVANDVPYTVAYSATQLGLPSISTDTAKLATDKLAMKQVFQKKGVRVPEFLEIKSLEELESVFEKWGRQLIIKPTDGRGARGVLLVDDTVDLSWAYEHALSYAQAKKVMVERYISGPQISTEGFVLDGDCVTVACSDRNYSKLLDYKPYIIEDGGTMPSALPQNTLDIIHGELKKAADALGLENGPIKGDVVLDEDGRVYIIEIATRLSGGYFCTDQIPLATGVDLVKLTMDFALGNSIKAEALLPQSRQFVAIRYWFPKVGTLLSQPKLRDIQSEDSVYLTELHHKDLSQFAQIQKHPDRLGFVITTDQDSYQNAAKKADDVIQKYQSQFVFE